MIGIRQVDTAVTGDTGDGGGPDAADALAVPAERDPYALRRLLHCWSCARRLTAATGVAGARVYRCGSGCLAADLDASGIEHAVRVKAEQTYPCLVDDLRDGGDLGVALEALIVRVVVGPQPDEVDILWPT